MTKDGYVHLYTGVHITCSPVCAHRGWALIHSTNIYIYINVKLYIYIYIITHTYIYTYTVYIYIYSHETPSHQMMKKKRSITFLWNGCNAFTIWERERERERERKREREREAESCIFYDRSLLTGSASAELSSPPPKEKQRDRNGTFPEQQERNPISLQLPFRNTLISCNRMCRGEATRSISSFSKDVGLHPHEEPMGRQCGQSIEGWTDTVWFGFFDEIWELMFRLHWHERSWPFVITLLNVQSHFFSSLASLFKGIPSPPTSLPGVHLWKQTVQHHRPAFLRSRALERQQEHRRPAGRLHLHPQRDLQRQRDLPVHVQPHPQVPQLRVPDLQQQDGRYESGVAA